MISKTNNSNALQVLTPSIQFKVGVVVTIRRFGTNVPLSRLQSLLNSNQLYKSHLSEVNYQHVVRVTTESDTPSTASPLKHNKDVFTLNVKWYAIPWHCSVRFLAQTN